jgi:hypothetical protein
VNRLLRFGGEIWEVSVNSKLLSTPNTPQIIFPTFFSDSVRGFFRLGSETLWIEIPRLWITSIVIDAVQTSPLG